MAREKVPEKEKRKGWNISCSPEMKRAATKLAKALHHPSGAAYVTGLIDKDLKKHAKVLKRLGIEYPF